jgi:hypothetical protein
MFSLLLSALAISNKDMYFIVAAAGSSKKTKERSLEGFRGFTSCLTGTVKKALSMEQVPGRWETSKEVRR